MERLKTKLPDRPGVYFFKKGRKILYIGKATSLRDRVRSYFSRDLIDTRGVAIVSMVSAAQSVSYKTTDSVLHALILESVLIKKYRPKYNIDEKDDKSYYFVVVSREVYPSIALVRGKELAGAEERKRYKKIFGPFPHGAELREALAIIRKIFPYRDKCSVSAGKLCFEAQIGLCPGICAGKVSRAEYGKNIRNISLVFGGKFKSLVRILGKEMRAYAEKQEFEKAQVLKRQISGLKHINDIALLKKEISNISAEEEAGALRIEAYDIAHLGGKNRVGAMAVVLNGEPAKSEYRKFRIRSSLGTANDIADLKEVLDRRFYHEEWRLPDVIVLDGGIAQLNAAESMLKKLHLDNVKAVAVTKNEFHRPKKIIGEGATARKYEKEILLANSEAHRFAVSYHKKIRGY